MLPKVYVCPTDEKLRCSWEGSSGDILEHFITKHEDLLLHSSEIDIELDLISDNRLLFLNEEIYLIQLKIENEVLKIGLRYLGPARIANSISYDVVLKIENQTYFNNYFDASSNIIEVNGGFWNVNLHALKELHTNLSKLQCDFNISTANIESVENESTNSTTIDEHFSDETSNHSTIINDEEIDEILHVEPENVRERDALDNMSSLNFSILENSSSNNKCRRYSSFIGIPQGLFDEKKTTKLSCSNCLINMLPPIYLCVNEHNICADCKYESCKICYEPVTESRNRDLEEYSRKCLHSCRYHAEGCKESFMYSEIRSHELKCLLCTYKCIEECSFRGKFHEFHSHFKIKHPSCKIYHTTPVNFQCDSEFFVCDSRIGIFHCLSMLIKNTTRWIVYFLGPSDRKFSCELTFKESKNGAVSFLKRYEEQYSIALTKVELKKLKVKTKNAILTISSYQ